VSIGSIVTIDVRVVALAQRLGVEHRCRPAREVFEQTLELVAKVRVVCQFVERDRPLFEWLLQRFRDVSATEAVEFAG